MIQSYSFCADNRLRIKWCDENLPELTGANPPSASIGKKYSEIFPELLVDGRDAVLAAIRENSTVKIKGYCCRFSNSQFIADITVSPEPSSSGGKPRSARITIFPKSTCNLASQLQSSRKLIDIGKIASILAHGVRNPLNAIKGAVVFLGEKYSGDPTLLEFTRIMNEEISRLDTFISRFLSTSIADMGQEVDINSLLKKIEIFTSLQASARKIKSIYTYGDVPPVIINSFQIEQAVLNVINNSIEAMCTGGSLKISTFLKPEKNPAEPDFVVIEITDTGPGICEGIEGISRHANEKGRGFGLFITREILRYYGGYIEIKSIKGTGTTVRLHLPKHKS